MLELSAINKVDRLRISRGPVQAVLTEDRGGEAWLELSCRGKHSWRVLRVVGLGTVVGILLLHLVV